MLFAFFENQKNCFLIFLKSKIYQKKDKNFKNFKKNKFSYNFPINLSSST